MSVRRQAGISLVELMVALLISSILILGVTDLFSSASISGHSNSELARIQEGARVAMEVFGEDARLAGMQACSTEHAKRSGSEYGELRDFAVHAWTMRPESMIVFIYIDPSTCGSDAPDIQRVVYYANNSALYRVVEKGLPSFNINLTPLDLPYEPTPILDNVDVNFALLPEGAYVSGSGAYPDANAIQITINAKSDRANFEARSFSSTYEFKNRVVKRDAEL